MSDIYVERVKRLYMLWHTVPADTVNLQHWACGTHACLVGHAAMLPVFNQEGLKLVQVTEEGGRAYPIFGNHVGWSAAMAFFGPDSDALFDVRGMSRLDEGIRGRRYNSLPDDWTLASERMRLWLTQRGVDVYALKAGSEDGPR